MSDRDKITRSSKRGDWKTPRWLFDKYNEIYEFTLDAAASAENALCENYFDKETDALDLDVPVPEIYGTIERKPDGTLYTTKAQRTGCNMCGFGIHMEKRPNRFDLLRERNPKEWEYWMFNCVTDSDTGEKYGWSRVLDYIGVDWR